MEQKPHSKKDRQDEKGRKIHKMKREVYSYTSLPQETRKISNKQSNFTYKGTRKRRTKPKVSRSQEIIKIRAEINEIEAKKNHLKRSVKLRAGSLKR